MAFLRRATPFAALLPLFACTARPPSEGANSAASSASATAVAVASSSSIASAPASSSAAPIVRTMTVHLVPLGKVSDATMDDTAAALKAHAPHVVPIIEARQALPKSAESTDKGRYRAELLLPYLAALGFDNKTMGVAEVDIVTDKNGNPNWGILGLGALDGRASVISTYRMKRAWEAGGGASEAVVHDRLWKISLHELGHTLGLDHCPTKGCIMEDAHGTVKTADAETELCPVCAKKFADAIQSGNATPIQE